MAINLDHVTEQITVTDTAANASLTVNPKGTGAFNIAAGSGGLNLSNGGTVTAITRTVLGSYTSNPTVIISAPTTANGVQATATVSVQCTAATIASGGTGYTVGDTISMVGGTFTSVGTFRVASVSGGVITSVDTPNFASYTVTPSNPVSVTGGTGSGATLNVIYFIGTFTITNAGSGYVEQPTVSFSGGGSTGGGAAYATVGSGTIVRGIGGNIDFYTAASVVNSSPTLRIANSTTDSFFSFVGNSSPFVSMVAQGSVNAIGYVGANGSGSIRLSTGGTSFIEQLRVSHTASAVNYAQATGAATGSGPTISAQGSDTNVDLNFTTKSSGSTTIYTPTSVGGTASNSQNIVNLQGVASGNLVLLRASLARHTTSADWTGVGYRFGHVVDVTPMSYIEFNPVGQSQGLSVNVAASSPFQVKTTGGEQLRVANTASAVNYLQVTGSATGNGPRLLAQGSDADIRINYISKGSGAHVFASDANAGTVQFNVSRTASAVNYVDVTGAATGNGPTISAQGSDATAQLNLTGKGGSGVVIFNNGTATPITFSTTPTASSVNYLNVTGSVTGFGPKLSALGTDTNIPLVLQPKGTGALQAQQTDSTATGGNARGANAVDWQTFTRSSAAQVASGLASSILGGARNTSSSIASVVVGGTDNTASANSSFIGAGNGNIASGTSGGIVSGINNTNSGIFAFIGAGQANTNAGYLGVVVGGAVNSGTSGSAVTTQSGTMNGTTAVTLSGSNANIKVGQLIQGTSIVSASGITPYTYVAAVSGTSLTLSQAASGSSTSTLSFFTPHGVVVGGGNNTATGSYSFIGGGGDAGTAGNRNVASGDWSVVVGGRGNIASGHSSVVIGGGSDSTSANLGSTASGIASTISGGLGHINSGTGATISGGYQHFANSTVSTIAGGRYGATRGISGYMVFPACNNPIFSSYGITQAALLVLGKQTTDATATVVTSDGGAAGTTNQVILPNNSAYFFTGEVVAGVTGGGNTKGWTIEGVIKRGANAASTALVGTPTVTSTYADAGASTWVIAVTADTTNGGLAVTFTGQASTTIRTVCQVRTTEMTF